MSFRVALGWLLLGCALHELWCAYGLWFLLGAELGPAGHVIVARGLLAAAAVGAALRGGPRWLAGVGALAAVAGLAWAVELVRDSVFTAFVRGPLWGVTGYVAARARHEAPISLRAPPWWPGAALTAVAALGVMAARDAVVDGLNRGGGTAVPAAASLGVGLALAAWRAPSVREVGRAAAHASVAALAAWATAAAWLSWVHAWWMQGALLGVVPAVLLLAVAATLAGTLATRPAAGRGALVASGVVMALWWARLPDVAAPLSHGYAPDRVVGAYPNAGGAEVPTQVDGEPPAVAHTLADGSRRCGDVADGPVLAFVGDSFTFGQGLPDEGTLCHAVREAYPALLAGWRPINLGQPGANAASSVETARFAIEQHGARVVVWGVLPGDDGRAFELNGLRRLTRQPWMLLAGTVVDVPTAVEVMMLSHELYPVEGYQRAVTMGVARRAAALASERRVPVVVDVNTPPGAASSALLGDLAALARDEPWLVWGGDGLLEPDPAHPDRATVFPLDGHPTAYGNALKARRLGPALQEALALVSAR